MAVRFEHGVQAREGVVVADAADLVEGETTRFAGRVCDGPGWWSFSIGRLHCAFFFFFFGFLCVI